MNDSELNLEQLVPSPDIPKYIGIIVAGLALPAILIPIVKLTGYSEVVEEISKGLIVFFLIISLSTFRKQLGWAIIFGLLFGLSESIFYLPTILQVSNGSLFFYRLITTVPMHALTALVMTASAKPRKSLIIIGFLAAVAIHLLFNFYVGAYY